MSEPKSLSHVNMCPSQWYDYTNYRGESSKRLISLMPPVFHPEGTAYHKGPHWICSGYEHEREVWRDFDLFSFQALPMLYLERNFALIAAALSWKG